MSKNKIQFIHEPAMKEIDKILSKIAILDRSVALKRGLRKAGNRFKKHYSSILPVSGAPDDTGRTPLAKSIKVKVIDRGGDVITAIIGEEQKGKKYIAHLVDLGFKIVRGGQVVGTYEGKRYLERTYTATKAEMDQSLIEGVRLAASKL